MYILIMENPFMSENPIMAENPLKSIENLKAAKNPLEPLENSKVFRNILKFSKEPQKTYFLECTNIWISYIIFYWCWYLSSSLLSIKVQESS